MRLVGGFLFLLSLSACGGRGAPGGGPFDFCHGEPWAEINGSGDPATATGVYMTSADSEAAAMVFTTLGETKTTVAVDWFHALGAGSSTVSIPTTVDLADIPLLWSVNIVSNCDFQSPDCPVPSDQWFGSLRGSLTILGDAASYEMTICLEGEPDPSRPNTTGIQSLRLWAAHVSANAPH